MSVILFSCQIECSRLLQTGLETIDCTFLVSKIDVFINKLWFKSNVGREH